MHFGMDNTGRDSQQGMLNLIRFVHFIRLPRKVCNIYATSVPRDMELDIVGLLETDLHVSGAYTCSIAD